jgi:hypothetical protein
MKLSTEDANQFFRLMWGLQFFVSQQRRMLPNVTSLEAYTALESGEKIKVRDALWKHPDLIDPYVQENPDRLSTNELSIIRDWKRFISGQFFVFRYLKAHTIFIQDSRVYGVLGLHDPIAEILYGRPLPVLAETVLLPYKGKIVFDGLFRTTDIYFGSGIRSDLNEQYQTAKQNGRILTSLEPEAAPAAPARRQAKPDRAIEAVVDEIVTSSEQLRGGTVFQNAAFGLLRASANLAQSAVQQPEDLEVLWRLGRPVQNVLNRLYKALERAER